MKALVHRLFAKPRDGGFLGPIILAAILALFWFGLAFLLLLRSGSHKGRWEEEKRAGAVETRALGRTIAIAVSIACTLALSAWIGLDLSDEIFESRLLPWIAPLIEVQHYGFLKASRVFPCQSEGLDTGCAYRWITAFLLANTLAYLPLVLVGVFSLRHSGTVRKLGRSAARRFAFWGSVSAILGLVVLQILHALHRDTYDSLYPNSGIGHWHFGVWEQVNDVTGTLVVLAGLLLPIYFYRAFRRTHDVADRKSRLADLTSVAALMVAALMLGNVH